MSIFTAPQQLPQDLLLICELVETIGTQHETPTLAQNDKDDIASSGDESEEIEKDLTILKDEESDAEKPIPSAELSSEPDSSDSESESEMKSQIPTLQNTLPTYDDDEYGETTSGATTYLQTKNEVVDVPIVIPDLEAIGMDEVLEKVGEVLSVVGDIVIVKGLPSKSANRASERALDSGTLLVFEDRKVLGYIYETFGPTSEPLYQIKFNQQYPLDPEKVQVGRKVFHVPGRSHFIFVHQLRQLKGSDASNVHDEEPGEDEIEFSDDEAEAVHRSRFKHRRGRERSNSVFSSRHLAPSQMRDQDMTADFMLNRSAFDEHSPYDHHDVGLLRSKPEPYDDLYSGLLSTDHSVRTGESSGRRNVRSSLHSSESRGRGRRGRGRGNQLHDHSQASFRERHQHHLASAPDPIFEAYDPRSPQESLPSFLPQNGPEFYLSPNISHSWGRDGPSSGYLQDHQFYMFPNQQVSYAIPSTFVQPHINPRFASTFGFQLPSNAHSQTAVSIPQSYVPAEQWSNPTLEPSEPEAENEPEL